MIDIYNEITTVLRSVNGLEKVDIAPRVEGADIFYPAAYISIDELKPMNALGNNDGKALVKFTVEYWLMPFASESAAGSASLDNLAQSLLLVEHARKAMLSQHGSYVYNTSLINERADTDKVGYYVVRQEWACVSYLWSVSLKPLPNLPLELVVD